MTFIELLSPARDLECGKAAIDHGADAVYIGGPSFGARAAAGNEMADIENLARYAHRYHAKVYLTLNTILFDEELHEALTIARQAWEAGADALIIQDMGLLELDLPPMPLIASTQMNNADASHIRFLERAGFRRAILARELSLEQIRDIRRNTSIELESFVHGSLCVSYSGRCCMSAALGGRSANRGSCGQPCRLAWDLIDSEGRILEENRHCLSLKDMDRSDFLADLVDSGVTAFKIEGRLKDTAYVKNVTAYYRTRIDALLDSRSDLFRASSGRTEFSFIPDPRKTFSRGATPYFLRREDDDVWSPDTPKATGEEIGRVTQSGLNWFCLDEGADIINAGDGLCFFDQERALQGLQVVRVTENRVQSHMPIQGLDRGTLIMRNRDHQFLKALLGETAKRKIAIHLTFRETADGFSLEGTDEDGNAATAVLTAGKEPAEKPDAAMDTVRKQLSRINDSIFTLVSLTLETSPYFLRTAELNGLRRELIASLEAKRIQSYVRPVRQPAPDKAAAYPVAELDYSYNVSNDSAREFYRKHGAAVVEPAFELKRPAPGAVLMTTRHCLRRSLGACPKQEAHVRLSEPLFIEHAGRRFRLAFDCANCRMQVVMD